MHDAALRYAHNNPREKGARRRKVFCRRKAADARPDDERRLIVIGQFPVSSLLMNSFLWSDVSHANA